MKNNPPFLNEVLKVAAVIIVVYLIFFSPPIIAWLSFFVGVLLFKL